MADRKAAKSSLGKFTSPALLGKTRLYSGHPSGELRIIQPVAQLLGVLLVRDGAVRNDEHLLQALELLHVQIEAATQHCILLRE